MPSDTALHLPGVLTTTECEQFHEQGYISLPGFLSEAECSALKAEVDQHSADSAAAGNRLPATNYEQMGLLATHPGIMDRILDLFGSRFSMHHHHCARHNAGNKGVGWHQDYEQVPQTNRSHQMVHVFFYLNGLNGEVGDLMVVPGSHKQVIARSALRIFGTAELPGCQIFDDLPPGSAVIVHSALWHGRRPKPGGEDRPRYFIDISYCQHGIQWPGTRVWAQARSEAIDRGYGRDGKFDWVFDNDPFFLIADWRERNNPEQLQGSLITQLRKESA